MPRGSARPVVRSFDACYEADGPFAVSQGWAKELFSAAVEVVSRYAGPIAVRFRPAVLPTPDNPFCIDGLKLGDAPHAALLTGRQMVSAEGDELVGDTDFTVDLDDGIVVASLMVVASEPTASRGAREEEVATAAHEFVHTFDIDHCQSGDATCAMQEVSLASPEDFDLNQFLRRPFCDMCAENIERAGALALLAAEA